MVYHTKTQMLTTFYSDRSIYHWFIKNNSKKNNIVKISFQYFHAGPLFDVKVNFLIIKNNFKINYFNFLKKKYFNYNLCFNYSF